LWDGRGKAERKLIYSFVVVKPNVDPRMVSKREGGARFEMALDVETGGVRDVNCPPGKYGG